MRFSSEAMVMPRALCLVAAFAGVCGGRRAGMLPHPLSTRSPAITGGHFDLGRYKPRQLADLAHVRSKQIVDRLRAARLDDFVQLPAIVVAGDTSSGKSSLLTAISGLQFPSSSGLTTRCPTEVILSKSPTTSAIVTLKQFPGMTSEQRSFRRILREDRSDFAAVISQATHLLTQGQDESYISPNGIVVKATGPDLCDLTLIDLPGLVAATGQDESVEIISRIRNMVQNYMRSPRAVILCLLPANNDFHNSAILTLAKDIDCDPTGTRTLGIVTKPDLVDRGAENDVLRLASNEKAKLQLGWHVVKLRSQQDLSYGKTLTWAENEEEQFFEYTPWNQLDKDDVGVPRLRARLQKLLLQRVQSELPAVYEEARKKLKAEEAELDGLGPKCDDLVKKRQFFSSLVGQCSTILEDASAGRYLGSFFENSATPDSNNLRARIFVLEKEFGAEIAKTRFMCIGDYDVGDRVMWKQKDGMHHAVIVAVRGEKLTIKVDALGSSREIDVASDDILPDRSDLLKLMSRLRGDALPGFESDVVFRYLVSQKITSWSEPSAKLRAKVVKLLQEISARAIEHTVPSSLPQLGNYLKRFLGQVIERSAERLDTRVQELLTTERERPYTQNHYYSDLLTTMRNRELQRRVAKLADRYGRVDQKAIFALLSSFGVGSQSIEEAAAVELEFRLAAYLKVASVRFVDVMPQILNSNVVIPLLAEVRNLQSQVSDLQLEAIAEEDAKMAKRRVALEESVKVLREALEVLDAQLQERDD